MPDDRAIAIADRRRRVFELWRLGMPQSEIAVKVNVSQPMVSADLRVIRKEFAQRYGSEAETDRIIFEGLDTIEFVKQRALREYSRMLPTAGQLRDTPAEVRARLKALDTAKQAAIDSIVLMQDLGFADRHLGKLDVTGSALAKAFRAIDEQAKHARPTDDENIPEIERAWRDADIHG